MTKSLKIVVPTDFSKESLAVLEWVKRLSDHGPAEVHCVNVVQEPSMYLPVTVGAVLPGIPSISNLERISQESLDAFVKTHMSDLNLPAVAKVITGQPAKEIADYAKEIDAQMIVIATHGKSALARVLLGSTAEGVVRQAECPVLTVRS